MANIDQVAVQWRRSSYSLANGDCVEVAHLDTGVAVRHSKHPNAPVLFFPLTRWREFLVSVKRGDLDQG